MRNRRRKGVSPADRMYRFRSLDGGITIFLSLTLTCICALLGGLFESARLAGCGWYTQMALNSSLDSLMSCYHREAWERYRLFLLEYDTEEQMAEEIAAYLSAYQEEAPFYRLENAALTASVSVRITDGDGAYLEEEILDYMRFGIWEMEQDPAALSELADGFREAEGFQEIAAGYQENGRKVLGLEKALDRVGECLKKQNEYLRDSREALSECSGGRFFRVTEKLEKELKRIPALVEDYEEEADRLSAELDASEAAARQQKKVLKAGTWGLAVNMMDQYRSYIDQEGSRRQEVRGVMALAEENLRIVEAAVREAKEVQEYIDAWEDGDDDSGEGGSGSDDSGDNDSGRSSDDSEDELDEEALWQQVLDVLDGFREDTRFQKSGIQDKKKMNVLESISRLAGTDLLEICVPDGVSVSGAWLEMTELPSIDAGIAQETMEIRIGNEISLSGLLERALLAEYTAGYFASFTGADSMEESAGEQFSEKGFGYEQEYILYGAASDRENLKAVVNRLIAVREAVNLLVILSDAKLRGEAEALALAVTGGAGLSPLTGVATFFIMTVWAFAESVEDVKVLLAGGELPFIKIASQWKVSLSGLAETGTEVWKNDGMAAGDGPFGTAAGSGNLVSEEKGKAGLNYQDWLKLFSLLQDSKTAGYRRMDIIQSNLRRKQSDFLMKKCAYRVEAQYTGEGPLVPIRRNASQEY